MKKKGNVWNSLLIMLAGIIQCFSSCGQSQTNVPKDSVRFDTKDIVTSPGSKAKYYAKYEYTDAAGRSLIIENSLPRGERYVDPTGKEYARAVFWTRITNETDNPLELTIDFSGDTYQFPGSVGASGIRYYKLLLPPDTMILEKENLRNYGLTDLNSFLENSIDKPSSLKRTIPPKESSGFVVVRLGIALKSDEKSGKPDGSGVTRAGFSLQGQDVFFTLNGKEIHCGSINLKNLVLKKRTDG